jgi:hypothetical protein
MTLVGIAVEIGVVLRAGLHGRRPDVGSRPASVPTTAYVLQLRGGGHV